MIKFRQFKETDRDYLTRSVLFSYLGNSSEVKRINKDSFMIGENKVINALINKCEVMVCCDDQDDDLIFGFVIYENVKDWDICHYVYLRKDFREKGIVQLLIKQIQKTEQLSLSHLTDQIKPARLKKYWQKVIYDPYAVLGALK